MPDYITDNIEYSDEGNSDEKNSDEENHVQKFFRVILRQSQDALITYIYFITHMVK